MRSLVYAQEEVTDIVLWTSLRALQEKEEMLRRLAHSLVPGPSRQSALEEAEELAEACTLLRKLTENSPSPRSFEVPTAAE